MGCSQSISKNSSSTSSGHTKSVTVSNTSNNISISNNTMSHQVTASTAPSSSNKAAQGGEAGNVKILCSCAAASGVKVGRRGGVHDRTSDSPHSSSDEDEQKQQQRRRSPPRVVIRGYSGTEANEYRLSQQQHRQDQVWPHQSEEEELGDALRASSRSSSPEEIHSRLPLPPLSLTGSSIMATHHNPHRSCHSHIVSLPPLHLCTLPKKVSSTFSILHHQQMRTSSSVGDGTESGGDAEGSGNSADATTTPDSHEKDNRKNHRLAKQQDTIDRSYPTDTTHTTSDSNEEEEGESSASSGANIIEHQQQQQKQQESGHEVHDLSPSSSSPADGENCSSRRTTQKSAHNRHQLCITENEVWRSASPDVDAPSSSRGSNIISQFDEASWRPKLNPKEKMEERERAQQQEDERDRQHHPHRRQIHSQHLTASSLQEHNSVLLKR